MTSPIITRYNKLTNREILPEHALRIWARDAVIVINNLHSKLERVRSERCESRNQVAAMETLIKNLKAAIDGPNGGKLA